MNTQPSQSALRILKNAKAALKAGNKLEARSWARKAVALLPENEEAWLIMAALASPRASLEYINKALEINPNSQRALNGKKWALARQQEKPPQDTRVSASKANIEPTPTLIPVSNDMLASESEIKKPFNWRWVTTPALVMLLVVSVALSIQYLLPEQLNASQIDQFAGEAAKETYTPSPTATYTPTSTPTPTFTLTPTSTSTATPLPPTPAPTQVSVYIPPAPSFSMDGRWIDVDLSYQRLTAYEGSTVVNSFIVSTGTWQYPTVAGDYQIYIKLPYQDMSGPGYYLPNVPSVMYFYEGYAIHGTYWHNNFGNPMSHGCVNLTISDALWMYNFATVGTWVHVHY